MWQWKARENIGSRCSTFWRTILKCLLVNAQHISKVPGRKTDVSDAEWIADLLRHGLLKASFIPPVGQRELRELTRYRSTFVKERATLVNRVQKVLGKRQYQTCAA